MTKSTLTNEQLRQRIDNLRKQADELKWMSVHLAQNAIVTADALSELLAAREARGVPVEPITRANKYPVSRPAPGRGVIVWDESGAFIGYGISVDTRESGVAIQIHNGRRLDSNYDLRWQYTLSAPPATAVQSDHLKRAINLAAETRELAKRIKADEQIAPTQENDNE